MFKPLSIPSAINACQPATLLYCLRLKLWQCYHGEVDVGGVELHVDLLVDEGLAVLVVVLPDLGHGHLDGGGDGEMREKRSGGGGSSCCGLVPGGDRCQTGSKMEEKCRRYLE